MMFFRHLVLFFMLIEIFTLFLVVGEIGFFKSFCLWMLSALIGIVIIQRQGMEMLLQAQGAFNRNAVPVNNLLGSLYLVFAGLLFLMPGFISDVLGFCLLIPHFRTLLQNRMAPVQNRRTPTKRDDEDVINGSYVRVEEPVDVIEHKNEGP